MSEQTKIEIKPGSQWKNRTFDIVVKYVEEGDNGEPDIVHFCATGNTLVESGTCPVNLFPKHFEPVEIIKPTTITEGQRSEIIKMMTDLKTAMDNMTNSLKSLITHE